MFKSPILILTLLQQGDMLSACFSDKNESHPLLAMPGLLWAQMRGPALGDYSPEQGCWEYPGKHNNTAANHTRKHTLFAYGEMKIMQRLL